MLLAPRSCARRNTINKVVLYINFEELQARDARRHGGYERHAGTLYGFLRYYYYYDFYYYYYYYYCYYYYYYYYYYQY